MRCCWPTTWEWQRRWAKELACATGENAALDTQRGITTGQAQAAKRMRVYEQVQERGGTEPSETVNRPMACDRHGEGGPGCGLVAIQRADEGGALGRNRQNELPIKKACKPTKQEPKPATLNFLFLTEPNSRSIKTLLPADRNHLNWEGTLFEFPAELEWY